MGLGKSLKKLGKNIGHAIEKPFKELGKGWWTEVREPIGYAALAAATVYSAGAAATALGFTETGAALTSTAAMGSAAKIGAGVGAVSTLAGNQLDAQREQQRIQQETAQRELEASFAASLKPDTAPAWDMQALQDRQAANARARKRAFSLSRTVNRPLALGSLAGRQTLG